MLIEDKRLLGSRYTDYLNEKYPPRKYVRHNLTSSNKMSKNSAKCINVKFMNPKLSSITLDHIHSNLDELKLDYINSLPEALTIIQKLKIKIMEYDSCNNKNIETAISHISNIEGENEFLKSQLLDCYEKLSKYSDKYGDEILNNHVYNIIFEFKLKWARIKVFKFITETIRLNWHYDYITSCFTGKKAFRYKLKGFIGLQKAFVNATFRDQVFQKRSVTSVKEIFYTIKLNYILNKNVKKLNKIQKAIGLIFYFKKLRMNVYRSREFKLVKQKSENTYYSKAIKKSFASLKVNLLHNVKFGFNTHFSNFNVTNNNLPSQVSIDKLPHTNSINYCNTKNKIHFTKFFRDIGKSDCSKKIKSNYVNSLLLVKNIFEKTHDKIKDKYSYKTKLTTLNKFFFHWKMFSVNANQNIDLILRVSKGVTSLFFHKAKKRIFLNDTENNIKLIQARTIYKSLQQSINKKKNKNMLLPLRLAKFNYSLFFDRVTQLAKLKSFYNDKTKPILQKYVFNKLKYNHIVKNQINYLKEFTNSVASKKLSLMHRTLFKLKLFKTIKASILINKKISIFRNKYRSLEIFSKSLATIRTKCLLMRIFKIKNYYINLINNMKLLLEEKSQALNEMELRYSLIYNDLSIVEKSNASLLNENEFFKSKLSQIEANKTEEIIKMKQLYEANLKDINSKNSINNI